MKGFTLAAILLPLIIFMAIAFLYLAYYIGKNKIKSQKKFFIQYWGTLIVLEIIFLLYIVIDGPVQYLPPSLVINFIPGTAFLIIYSVQCLSSKTPLMTKLKFIGMAAMLNYIIAPFSLAFLS